MSRHVCVLLACEPLCTDTTYVVSKTSEVIAAKQGTPKPDWAQVLILFRAGSAAFTHIAAFQRLGAHVKPFQSKKGTFIDDRSCDRLLVSNAAEERGVLVGFWNGKYRGLRDVFGLAKAAHLQRYQIGFKAKKINQMKLNLQ